MKCLRNLAVWLTVVGLLVGVMAPTLSIVAASDEMMTTTSADEAVSTADETTSNNTQTPNSGTDTADDADDADNAEGTDEVTPGEGEEASGVDPDAPPMVLTYEILEEEFRLAARTDQLEMWWRRADHNVAIVQRWNKKIWTTFPYDIEQQIKKNEVQGKMAAELRSHLVLRSVDRVGMEDTMNSLADSIRKRTPEDLGVPNANVQMIYPPEHDTLGQDPDECLGIRFTYYFPEKRVSVPIEYHLETTGLRVGVPVEDIIDDNDYSVLTDIRPAPYFGAGNATDQGYALIPDGCGAIMNFNNGKSQYANYSSQIYGFDHALSMLRATTGVETVTLPIFGIQQKDAETGQTDAFLAIVTQGEAVGTLLASAGGKGSPYNSVGTRFKVRLQDVYTLINTAGKSTQMVATRPGYLNGGKIEVSYTFLKDDPTWLGMANAYRSHLQEQDGMATQSDAVLPLYVELYGAVSKKVPVLGFQTLRNVPLTTYAEAQEIMQTLKDQGVSEQVLRYMSWTTNAQMGEIMNAVQPEKGLGGRNGLQKLQQYTQDNNIGFYPDFDLVNVLRGGNGFKLTRDSAKALSGAPQYQERYMPSILFKESYVKGAYFQKRAAASQREAAAMIGSGSVYKWVLTSPYVLPTHVDKLQKSLSKNNLTSASVGSFTNSIYSDCRNSYITRDRTQEIWTETLAGLSADTSLMGVAGNSYSFPYVSHMIDVPVTSSQYFIFDYDVPLYQTVLRGSVPYGTPAINLMSSPRTGLLHAIESGSALKFTFIYANGSKLKETDLQHLYSVQFDQWADDAAAFYAEWREVFSDIGNAAIVDYAVDTETGVRKVTYATGHVIYVNYSDAPQEIDGKTIAANGYLKASR